MKDHKNISDSDLKSWGMLQEFRKILAFELKDGEQSKSEIDPRRKLHYIDYATSILFVFFNPVISSMRGLCTASGLGKVQKCVTSIQLSLASFSEAQHTFDSEALKSLMLRMASKISPSEAKDFKILSVAKDLVAVDGSLFQMLSRVLWAEWREGKHKAAKLHLGFSVLSQTAVDAVITKGNSCERKALLEMVEEGVMYVCDRYYGLDYDFFGELLELGALFVIRIRNKPKFTVIKEYELTDEDLKEGVISDQLVQLGDPARKLTSIRMVKVQAYDGEILIVCSECPDKVSATAVSKIYRCRWQIEVFFKWLKSLLGCRRLLAESPEGVAKQMYCAIIGAILLFCRYGKKPTKRQMEMIRFYFMGWATIEELDAAFAPKKKKEDDKNKG